MSVPLDVAVSYNFNLIVQPCRWNGVFSKPIWWSLVVPLFYIVNYLHLFIIDAKYGLNGKQYDIVVLSNVLLRRAGSVNPGMSGVQQPASFKTRILLNWNGKPKTNSCGRMRELQNAAKVWAVFLLSSSIQYAARLAKRFDSSKRCWATNWKSLGPHVRPDSGAKITAG